MQDNQFEYSGKDKPIILGTPSSVDSYLVPSYYRDCIHSILISEGQILARTEKLAHEVAKHYQDRPYMMLVILKGAVPFYSALEKSLSEIYKRSIFQNRINVEYIRCESYVDDKSSGEVKITAFFDLNLLNGKEILIVEDIIDTGNTLAKFSQQLIKLGVKDVKVACFIQKTGLKEPCRYDKSIDFLGFIGPNYFYIGFGLDYNQQFRDLKHLCAINEYGKQKFKSSKEQELKI